MEAPESTCGWFQPGLAQKDQRMSSVGRFSENVSTTIFPHAAWGFTAQCPAAFPFPALMSFMKLRPRASFLLLLLIAAGLLWGWRQGQVSASGTRRDADGMRLRAVEGVEAVPSAAVLHRPAVAAEAAVKPGSVRGYSMSRGFWKPQSPAPWPGVTPAATAQALYGCADFFAPSRRF